VVCRLETINDITILIASYFLLYVTLITGLRLQLELHFCFEVIPYTSNNLILQAT